MGELIEEEFGKDFALLVEAGFIAVKQLDESSATRLFHAAQVLNPTSTAPKIGLGYISLNKLELKKAVHAFEEVIKIEPSNMLAQTFLGMCFLLNKAKRKQGETLILQAIEKTDDSTIKKLGTMSLEWNEKELKKSKSPLFEKEI